MNGDDQKGDDFAGEIGEDITAAEDLGLTDPADGLADPSDSEQPESPAQPQEEKPVAKKTKGAAPRKTKAAKATAARKGSRKAAGAAKATRPRAAKAAEGEAPAFEGTPKPEEMRLARGGVSAGADNTIRLAFTNGYTAQLKPSDWAGSAALGETRDLLVAWMRKRLGADRT